MNISSSKGHDAVIINRPVPAEADRCLCFKGNVLKYEVLVKGLGQDRNTWCVCVCVNVCAHIHVHVYPSAHTQICCNL